MTARLLSKIIHILRKPCFIWITLLVVFILFIINHFTLQMIPQMEIKNLRLPAAKHYKTRPVNQSLRIILYWNTFFDDEDMGLGLGSKIFDNCPVSNCYTTHNRSLMNMEQFDAILFHGAQYESQKDGIPEKRSLHQKYIFYSFESPFNCHFDKYTNENFYNTTMTYRGDSDIHAPYGTVDEKRMNYSLPDFEVVKRKKNMIAWFVSNCHSHGTERRMKYALELNKYIPVHIYGSCGNHTCPRELNVQVSMNPCYKMLERDYKFYLSFENTMCSDYVTEKMFNVLKFDIIPIVMGNSDYNKVAPPLSVIDVNDFDSPKALSEYLYELDSNYEEYVKYFEWKKNYDVILDTKEYILCQLCELLNRPLVYSSYENIVDWFYGFKCFL